MTNVGHDPGHRAVMPGEVAQATGGREGPSRNDRGLKHAQVDTRLGLRRKS